MADTGCTTGPSPHPPSLGGAGTPGTLLPQGPSSGGGTTLTERGGGGAEQGEPARRSKAHAGKELLHFLSLNEATVCNTWFMKKDIYKGTWQHHRSKNWHCIDYAIVRTRDKRSALMPMSNEALNATQTTSCYVSRCVCQRCTKQLGQMLTHTDMIYPNWLAQVWTRMERTHPRAGSRSWLTSLPNSNGK